MQTFLIMTMKAYIEQKIRQYNFSKAMKIEHILI